jgi:hypothetical protein
MMTKPPSSYAQYFALESSDPYHGVYGPVLQEYRTKHAAPSHTTLTELAYGSDVRRPMAFIALIKDYNWEAGRSLLVHGIHKYPSTVGIPTEWDDNIYAFLGDIEDGDITTITFDA